MGPLSRLEVNLSAIEHNIGVLRRVLDSHAPIPGGAAGAGGSGGGDGGGAGGAMLCAVLKADAYGLGARRLARRLDGRAGMIAVYSLEQARQLVEGGIGTTILVLMPVYGLDRRDPLYGAAVRGQLHLSVHDNATLDSLIDVANGMGLRLPVHLEVDTGLGRCGSSGAEALVIAQRLSKQKRLRLAGVYTHCSCSDTDRARTESQADTLDGWLQRAGDLIPADALIHQASTFGVFRGDRYHRSMVRVGLALFGYAAEEFAHSEEFEHAGEARTLRPAVRWTSSICQSRQIEKGGTVGYGATWAAARRTRTAIIPVGYADGYPIPLSNRAKVGVVGEDGVRGFAPVIGRVSMDQIVIDTTDLTDSMAKIGAEVELIGTNAGAPNHLPVLAHQAGTISHALMCGIGPRVPRVYMTDHGLADTGTPVVTVAPDFRGKRPIGASASRAVI